MYWDDWLRKYNLYGNSFFLTKIKILQNKYKNRKDSVSSLLDDTEITDKIQMLKSVQEHILGRVEKEIGDKEKQIGVVSQRVNEIKRQTDHCYECRTARGKYTII